MISSEDRILLIAMRIKQAEKAAQRAETSFALDQPEMVANRIYYGMFYAMLALALLRGFETSKHQQMIGWFNKNFVHTDIFPKRFTAMLKKAFDARMDADYEPDFEETDIETMLDDMKIFISTIKAWLEANPV